MNTVMIDGKTVRVAAVKSVTSVGPKHVYDLEVRDHHNYYANGILVHNCEYHRLLDYSGQKLGKELYRSRDLFLHYYAHNLEMLPSNPTKRGLRGRTRWLGAVDELGWFPVNEIGIDGREEDERERADGTGVYDALDRSLLTVRQEVIRFVIEKGINTIPQAFNILLSSPSHENDKICRLYREKQHSKVSLALRLPTWEVNPLYTRDTPMIAEAYAANPVNAARDYEAIPPRISSDFIVDSHVLRQQFKNPPRVIPTVVEKVVHNVRYRYARVVCRPENETPPSIMAIDAGYTNNSFAISVGYKKDLNVAAGQKKDLHVTVPVMFEIMPAINTRLHYNAIYEFAIKPIIEQFNVCAMFADRWQSIALLHRAMSDYPRVMADMYSVKERDFDLTRSMYESGLVYLPKEEFGETEKPLSMENPMLTVRYPSYFFKRPSQHLLFQMFTVQSVGNKYEKGTGYTDDILRTQVLLLSRLHDDKVIEHMKKQSVKQRDSMMVGTTLSFSGNYNIPVMRQNNEQSAVAVLRTL
jgi:hypothetical protein